MEPRPKKIRSEQSDQAIKDDFHRSKFLIPVANASTGDVYVTTLCSSCMMACMPSVTIPLHDWMIVPRTTAVILKQVDFARLLGGFVRTPSNPPWLRACTGSRSMTQLSLYSVSIYCLRMNFGSWNLFSLVQLFADRIGQAWFYHCEHKRVALVNHKSLIAGKVAMYQDHAKLSLFFVYNTTSSISII